MQAHTTQVHRHTDTHRKIQNTDTYTEHRHRQRHAGTQSQNTERHTQIPRNTQNTDTYRHTDTERKHTQGIYTHIRTNTETYLGTHM